jgi:hypothetical protein
MNNDTMLLKQKTDTSFRVDFGIALRYIALLKSELKLSIMLLPPNI